MVDLRAQIDKDLATWTGLNEALKNADEDICEMLLEREKEDRKRKQFLLRIHSRLNKVRADRERDELRSIAK